MAQKLKEFVRNSPLTKRRMGGYAVMEFEQKDPFQQGIPFHAHYVGSVETQNKHDCPEIQRIITNALKQTQKSRYPKVTLTVRSTGLRVKDVRTNVVDDYPIYLVSYCGASSSVEQLFFFIHKTKIEKVLRVEIFKLSNSSKVTAITLTVAKAFNIAYKAWMTEKRRKEREGNCNKGSESPLLTRRQVPGSNGKSSLLQKMAPGVTGTDGPYTPPVGRRLPIEDLKHKRSGSFGDIPDETASKNPAVIRVQAQNEVTGSTHNLILTEEFDVEFKEIAETSSQPDQLSTSLRKEPNTFDLQEVMKHADTAESVEDLSED